MNLEVKEDRSLADRIAGALADRIISGAIAPGEWLRQDHIAAEFGASHVPVREAFRRLEAQGLAAVEPRRGVRAAPLEPADVLEMAKMRAAFEALALREAIPVLDAHALEELDAILDQEAVARGIAVLGTLNLRFHRALTVRCGMPRLVAAIGDMHRASARHLYATWQQLDWQDRSNDEHRNIVRAIREGDVDAACAALSAHILAAGDALAQALRRR
ncbi:GntR family transcriptional regulator [Burkholderia sola]|uniref:GntR family transcriptional regulator n=1 Tax=Burkholderia sola TaxID=2843302 RepID=UPI001C31EDE7|nr:GntR family transcriptional regulator [Burkholderia cenocepacia]CAG2369734.1 GntR family transcriptional regulator [Burkholderia cenocepacia]CAG2369783.1 GntR family transcriptional regulator [Burkholderia cenocepacia]CAG2369793.1 GntR family transcriptional regulator [Burkholderia cenocepacia]CAG2369804.1 GntR family transcriptional regulator [Burkholderia cenocepacia]